MPQVAANVMSDERGSHIWFLRNTSIFEDQTDSMYESADTRARQVTFSRGDVLSFLEGSRRVIYLLMEGQVKLRSFTEGGKEIILDVLGPDDVFGPIESAVAPGGGSVPGAAEAGSGSALAALPSEAVALTKGSALQFEFDYFTQLVRRRPTIVVNLTRILGLRQRRFELRLTRLLYRSSLGKVAGLLAELGERYGTRTGDRVELNVRLTHQEMASITGLKRETVSESLAELEHRELIEARRGKVVLLKPDDLDRIA